MTKENDKNQIVRCAIYTRKSTDEGREQDFTSLDAQRESAESYIASQKQRGWVTLETKYDDFGFTGANMERPALQQLIKDIKEAKIDCVVVYKVDRLSRALMDFSKLLNLFDQYGVTFVSVTQHFNTDSSMGRLTLNILLSFAQFERELISERITDKIGASRRKGKHMGGCPPLGYNLDKEKHKLVINPEEAELVRHIFNLYIKKKSLLEVTQIVNAQGYRTKVHSADGKRRGGVLFKKTSIQWVINNVTYIGKVQYKDKLYDGEHEAILSEEIFNDAQAILKKNHRPPGSSKRKKQLGLLSNILYCQPCKKRMVYTYVKKGPRNYKYYVCQTAVKLGYTYCKTKMVAAHLLEDPVVASLDVIGWDDLLFSDQRQKILERIERIDVEREWERITVHFTDKTQKYLRINPDGEADPKAAYLQFPTLKQLLLLAHQIKQILDSEKAEGLGEISKWTGISSARLHQVMGFLNLCPKIQEDIILGDEENFRHIPEYKLRPILQSPDPDEQITLWRKMVIVH
ncbi:MAG: recombinase family protein [Candidatus Omnitrophota bacterium]